MGNSEGEETTKEGEGLQGGSGIEDTKETSKVTDFKCSECNQKFMRKDGLIRHVRTQHETVLSWFKCPVENCLIERRRKDHLRQHIRQFHKLDPSQLLPTRSPTKVEQSSPSEKRFQCPVPECSVELSRRDHLYRHIRRVHKAEPSELLSNEIPLSRSSLHGGASQGSFICPVDGCGTHFSWKTHVYRHLKTVHKEANPSEKYKQIQWSPLGSPLKRPSKRKREVDPHSPELADDDQVPTPHSDDETFADVMGRLQCKLEPDDKEELSLEEGQSLCAICCSPFSQEPPIDNISQVPSLSSFIKATVTGEHLMESVGQLTICTECHGLINVAMEKKVVVDELESTVKQLESLLALEKKKLERRLVEYYVEMRKIKGVVSRANLTLLEAYLKRNTLNDRTQENSLVLLLRDGILSTISQLQRRSAELKGKAVTVSKRRKTKPLKRKRVNKRPVSVSVKKEPVSEEDSLEKPADVVEDEPMEGVADDFQDREYSLRERKPNPLPKVGEKQTENKNQNDPPDGNTDGDDNPDSPEYDDGGDSLGSDDEDFVASADEISESEGSDSSSSEHDYSNEDSSAEWEDVSKMESREEPRHKDSRGDGGVKKPKSAVKLPKEKKERIKSKAALRIGIDVSGWTKFKIQLLKATKHVQQKRDRGDTPGSLAVDDPRLQHRLEYNPETDQFSIGGILVILHEADEFVECSSCSFRAFKINPQNRTAANAMKVHVQREHLSIFQCPICPSKLGSFKRYTEHLTSHKGAITCPKCDKVFGSDEALTRHTWSWHMSAEDRELAIQQGQKDPRRKKPEHRNPFQCTTCGKSFTQSYNLRLHERTHSGVRDMCLCPNCGSSFLGKAGLLHHQKYTCFPPGEEPPRVPCDQCPKDFKNKVLLARHMKEAHSIAAVEKPFRCETCGSGFPTNNRLKRHMISHSDERPHSCTKGCGAAFKHSKHLRRHEKGCSGVSSGRSVGRERKIKTDGVEVQGRSSEPATKIECPIDFRAFF